MKKIYKVLKNSCLVVMALFLTVSMNAQDHHDEPYSIENYLATLDLNDKACFLNGANNSWTMKPSQLNTQFPDEINPQMLNQQALPGLNEVLTMEMQDLQSDYLYQWDNVLGQAQEWKGVVGRGTLSTDSRFFEDAIKFVRVTRIDNENFGDSYQIHYAWYVNGINEPVLDVTHLVKLVGNTRLVLKKVVNNIPRIPSESMLTLSPNPAKDNVKISLEGGFGQNTKIKILTITGIMLQEVSGQEYNSKEMMIDLKGFKVGAYFVEVYKNNRKLETKTLIVKK